MTYTTEIQSPIGLLTAASDGDNITGLWIEGQMYYGATMQGDHQQGDLPVFGELRRWLDTYFAGGQPDNNLPLAPQGSPFRQRVWEVLLAIPYGQTTTYGAIAHRLDWAEKKPSPLAVGGAVGHNPISIVIPCHRVLGSDGSLTGYAGGLEVKSRLLQLEGVAI